MTEPSPTLTHRMMVLILQLGVVLFMARLGGLAFERMRLPAVWGELSAGLIISPYLLGGMKYAELLTESCLAVAEQRANDEAGGHTAAFYRLLGDGIARDRKQGASYFGPMTVTAVQPSRFSAVNYPVTYKEETW